MPPGHQSLLLLITFSLSSLSTLAAPALSGFTADVVTETILVLPTSFPPASSTSGPDTSIVATSASQLPAPDLLASELSAGSLSWAAVTETVLHIASPTSALPSGSYEASSQAPATLDATSSGTLMTSSQSGQTYSAHATTLSAPSSSSAHSVADVLSSSSSASSTTRTTLYVPSSLGLATHVHDIASSPSATSLTSATTSPASSVAQDVSEPTDSLLADPNPTSEPQSASNAASQQARRSAVVAAFLVIGTLTTLGLTIMCMRCKVISRLRRVKRRSRKVRFDLGDSEQGQQATAPPVLREKDAEKNSLVPGPPMYDSVTLPVLAQQPHPSACAPPPVAQADWRVFASNTDGQFEDVTHILSTDVFAPLERGNGSGSPTADSILSTSSAHSSSEGSTSRTSGAAESYKSCESRYSTPSVERRSRDGPPGSGSADSMYPSISYRSPSPTSPTSPELVQTPEQGAHVSACPVSPLGSKDSRVLRHGLCEADDADAGSEWDVARAYRAPHSSLGKDSVISVVVEDMDADVVDVGGRKCLLVQG
ncbi:hypothetical protein WOLCODRAFT_144166 [Wolfiporia cocos MD-104 SS10]|uniref:REJ domain-containing protein n=1 Tax=Wolfiporia cocos (strain MD-104) TaxID=742152 RepID=A0A2H3K2P6_WOLCO|nr:hypothetical protein WOLCODRAFT_144166 [Wolfiporia cocos MD-104 SS10]